MAEAPPASDLVWLTKQQIRRIEPYFPRSHGVPSVDDQRIVSGIIFVIRNGLRGRDAPAAYETLKTIYERFIRWSRRDVFNRIFAGLAVQGGKPDQLMVDATHLKAHRTAASLLKIGTIPRRIGRTRGGLKSKQHAICDDRGRPRVMLHSERQTSDSNGAALMFKAMPQAPVLLADLGYDIDWFRQTFVTRGTVARIPSRKNRRVTIPHDATLYRRRHRIENMFGRIKDWRRIHTRCDRCAHTFIFAIASPSSSSGPISLQ